MNVDKAENDRTKNTDTEKCEDDHNLLVVDIISATRNREITNSLERNVECYFCASGC